MSTFIKILTIIINIMNDIITVRRSKRSTMSFSKPSLTRQAFKDECDVNNVVQRWLKTGVVDHVRSSSNQQFLDCTQVNDYHNALNVVINAENAFNELSAHVRERFDNDPAKYLAFMSDAANTEEAIKLGLATRSSTMLTRNDSAEAEEKIKESVVETKVSTKKKTPEAL